MRAWLRHAIAALRRRLPRGSVRLKLTLLYGELFLASGAVLLTVTYFLVRQRYTPGFFVSTATAGFASGSTNVTITGGPGKLPGLQAGSEVITKQDLLAQAQHQSAAALHQLFLDSSMAFAGMAIISIWLGWLVAGRVLAPLRTITNAARDISASNLHRRLALDGPDDELTQLADTFDDLLGRLEASFEAQRQFVANASHELRTPLTLERALVEVALADPDATVESLRATFERVLATGEQQERLIEALLTLSRSQRGLDRHEPFDLAAVAEEVLLTRHLEAVGRGLQISAELGAAPASGDQRLGERLVANLLDNAIRHNVEGGSITIKTASRNGHSILSVANTGPVVPATETTRLLEPFQRLDASRNGQDGGLGLGLSIIQAIAIAHDAGLAVWARAQGGLSVDVTFPAAAGASPSAGVQPR